MRRCTKCGEHLEDQFDTCWNCGRSDQTRRQRDNRHVESVLELRQPLGWLQAQAILNTQFGRHDWVLGKGLVVLAGAAIGTLCWLVLLIFFPGGGMALFMGGYLLLLLATIPGFLMGVVAGLLANRRNAFLTAFFTPGLASVLLLLLLSS